MLNAIPCIILLGECGDNKINISINVYLTLNKQRPFEKSDESVYMKNTMSTVFNE